MNNNETKQSSIKDAILHKIHTKELSMRPKLYFTIKVVSTAVLSLAVLLISVFIINFILFSIRINSHEMLLSFGPRGWGAFFHFFPWGLLILDIALIFILERLVRHFRFGYKIPVLYLLLGLLASIGLLGFAIDRGTDMNERMLRRSDAGRQHSQPFDIYRGVRHPIGPGSALCLCKVKSIVDGAIVVRDTRSTTTLTLVLDDKAPYATSTGIVVGDTVFVAGEMKGGVVNVFGIKKVPQKSFPLSMPR
ncbi:MAG: hypothetical protein WC791_00055 [Candidatus Paceibacterota bacterium]|jgi:hypothetical protein